MNKLQKLISPEDGPLGDVRNRVQLGEDLKHWMLHVLSLTDG